MWVVVVVTTTTWFYCCGVMALASALDSRVGDPDVLFKFDRIDCETSKVFPSTGTIGGYSLVGKADGTSCPDSHGVTLEEDDGATFGGRIGSLTSNKDMSDFLGAGTTEDSGGLLTLEFWLRGGTGSLPPTSSVLFSTLFMVGIQKGSSHLVCNNYDLLIKAFDYEATGIELFPISIQHSPSQSSASWVMCDEADVPNPPVLLRRDELYHIVLVYTSSAVEVFINGDIHRMELVPKATAAFSTLAFRDNLKFHIGKPEADTSDYSWSGTMHLFSMYNKALTTNEVEKNYAAYLPDSMPVVRDVSFTVIEDELTPIQFSVGEDGGTIFDFDDDHRPTHGIGEGFSVEDKDSARSELCINSLPTKGTLWVDGTELTAENTQFPYPIGTTLESSHKKVEYLTAKDGNNIDGQYATFKLCAHAHGSDTCTSSTNSEGEEETDTSTVTISVTAVNDSPTVAGMMAEEVFAQEPLVITLDAHDVEDDLDVDAHVGVVITRLPENTDPDGESAGKLYEVSSNGVCNRSKPVELEKKLSSLQVCYLYGSGDGAGAVVAEVEFEYRAIDSEGATSKGSEDGVVEIKVKNQLAPIAAEQWAFEDGLIPEDPALRPTRDFINPSKQPVVKGMNLLQLKGDDRSSEDRAFKYFISSLPSHGQLFDVTVATSVGGDTEADLREHEISVDDFVGDSDKPGFLLSSEEGYVYYQPDLNYFNRRLYMLDSELTDKELGIAPDTFEFGLLTQDDGGDITLITDPATHSVKVINVHDPTIVTVDAGMKAQEGIVGASLKLTGDWVTVTSVDEVEEEDEVQDASTIVDAWDLYRLRVTCPAPNMYIDLSPYRMWWGTEFQFCGGTTGSSNGYMDLNEVCLEAPLRVIRQALSPLAIHGPPSSARDTCTVSVVAVEPECESTAAVCLELAAGDGASDTIDITFLVGLPPGSEAQSAPRIQFLPGLSVLISILTLGVICAMKCCPRLPCCSIFVQKNKQRDSSSSSSSSTSLLPFKLLDDLEDRDSTREEEASSWCAAGGLEWMEESRLQDGQQQHL